MNEFKKFAILTAEDVAKFSKLANGDLASPIGLFKKDSISDLYVHKGHDEVKEKLVVTVAPGTLTAGQTAELYINYVREGLNASEDNTRMPDRDKPLSATVTIASGETAASLVTKLVAIYNKAALMADYKIINVSNSGAALTIEAVDCYQRLKEVALNIYADDLAARPISSVDLVAAGTHTKGEEGAGTYKRLVKDAILPTTQNTSPFGDGAAWRGEYPVPGVLYDQISWDATTVRNNVAHGVVNHTALSKVHTVIYVPNTVSASLITLLTDVAGLSAAGTITASASDDSHAVVAPAE